MPISDPRAGGSGAGKRRFKTGDRRVGHSLTESLKVFLRNPDITDVSFTFTKPSKGTVHISSEKKLPAIDLGWADEWVNSAEKLTIAPFLKEPSYFEQEPGQFASESDLMLD